jgi:hypothetical protein
VPGLKFAGQVFNLSVASEIVEIVMSKEFKIANWKVEVDWSGMTLAPVGVQGQKAERKRRKAAPRDRKPAVGANLQQPKSKEQGDHPVWA